jgi:hypothetical protein
VPVGISGSARAFEVIKLFWEALPGKIDRDASQDIGKGSCTKDVLVMSWKVEVLKHVAMKQVHCVSMFAGASLVSKLALVGSQQKNSCVAVEPDGASSTS